MIARVLVSLLVSIRALGGAELDVILSKPCSVLLCVRTQLRVDRLTAGPDFNDTICPTYTSSTVHTEGEVDSRERLILCCLFGPIECFN